MTELQTLRKALISQIGLIEEKKADDKEVQNLVSISNTIIKSYNTELRADELKTTKKGIEKNLNNKVFDNEDKVQ